MKLFSRRKYSPPLETSAEYFIAATVKARGEIKTEADVVIDGVFDGKVSTSGLLEIGKNAQSQGDFAGRALIVEGQVNGNIQARDEVQIRRCATIEGAVKCGEIEVEKGAIINSRIEVKR